MKNTELKSTEFKNLISEYADSLKGEKKSDTYITERISYLRELFSYAETNDVYALLGIEQELMDNYLFYIEQERLHQRAVGLLEVATINKHKTAIRVFWKYLFIEKIKAKQIRVRRNKKTKQQGVTVLTHDEVEQLYSVCDESAIGYRDKACLALYYGLGLRKSEGLKIQIADIDFPKGRIFIRKSKNNRERYAILSPKVQKQLEEYVYNYREFYLPERSKHQALLIGERGNPISPSTLAKRIEHLWQRVKDSYGNEKHVTCHDLRHTLGTHLYMTGFSVEMIALMLGHRTLEATQLYIHSANQLKTKNNNE